MKRFVLFFACFFCLFNLPNLIALPQKKVSFDDYVSLRTLHEDFLKLEKTNQNAAVDQLVKYFMQLSRCLSDVNAINTFPNYAVGEALFFINQIYDSEMYKLADARFPKETQKVKNDIEQFLKSYLPKKNGSEVFGLLQITPEKRQLLQEIFKLPLDSLNPVPLDIPFSYSLQDFNDAAKKVVYYRMLEQSQTFFATYKSSQIQSFFENPFLLFSVNKTNALFSNEPQFLADLQNHLASVSAQLSTTNSPKEKSFYDAYSFFSDFHITESEIAKMKKKSASFYRFNAYIRALTALFMQYGIRFDSVFSAQTAQYLQMLFSDELLLLHIYETQDIEKNLPALQRQYETILYFAPRYHKMRFNLP